MIEGVEYTTVTGDFVTIDLIIWRRYRTRAPGIVEATMDMNPHIAKLHRDSVFLPVGTQLRIPIDPSILANAPQPKTTVQLWGDTPPITLAPGRA